MSAIRWLVRVQCTPSQPHVSKRQLKTPSNTAVVLRFHPAQDLCAIAVTSELSLAYQHSVALRRTSRGGSVRAGRRTVRGDTISA
jgi:hypothetical protein